MPDPSHEQHTRPLPPIKSGVPNDRQPAGVVTARSVPSPNAPNAVGQGGDLVTVRQWSDPALANFEVA